MSEMMKLTTIPEQRLLIDLCKVELSGVPAAAYVAIEATLTDGMGQAWSSRGIYTADMNGVVDTLKSASLGGTYRGVDTEGLFWSMLPISSRVMG
ncbi:MAG: acyl-CoA thioesterase/BAAT N-terminal domain-containing protein, partial [Pseudomonadota bacterium]